MENKDKEIEVILDLISDVIGKPIRSYETKHQYLYNCPACDEGQNKGNFEISLTKHLYHCWSCGDENDKTHGPLGKLFDVFGTKKQKKLSSTFVVNESLFNIQRFQYRKVFSREICWCL